MLTLLACVLTSSHSSSTQSLTLTGSVLNNVNETKLAINLIKKDLLQKNFPSRKKALIIQALRWVSSEALIVVHML